MNNIFRHLLVLGRPACGKSEFIDFLKHCSEDVRRRRLHIGRFEEVDDFPWLWEKFQDDEIWQKTEHGRQYTEEYMPGNPGMAPKGAKLFDWCMHKFNDVIGRQYVPREDFYRDSTLLIEFSRGGADGFRRALGTLDRPVLDPAAIFYIKVSREESWRRNVARYQEKLKHSILAHMVPRETYDYFYDINDWDDLTGGNECGWVEIERSEVRGPRSEVEFTKSGVGSPESGVGVRAQHAVPVPTVVRVPFVSMNNEPESTDPSVLEERYAAALGELWRLRSGR